MSFKLFDSELKVMDVLWREGAQTAGQLAKLLKAETGWNRNTTYTVIKKCVEKGAIERQEPGFVCVPLISKEEVLEQETGELIDKLFDGSTEQFFASFIKSKGMTKEKLEQLRKLVDEHK
ncbi:BlaI/MecI/CopY family transcriptional regulator [Paenibacillus sp. PDC88]|uniref:BlaI/MecI/CopY family transcriptional regulator n=1 Tax=Paenibacillus sp. PDC88 TaxID=1884375 RepID=UPI00089803B4|nr:BlaI/MecI/CopY family transcriptional regulator [Paenibacillus sp. PDC88]SDW35212.1 Predicted transcriptional regulator [Paenibacillus sp. PDC88]